MILLPGTGVIYTLAIGLAALLHTSTLAFQIIKYLGVAYLFYMAWKILKNDSVMEVSENKEEVGFARLALTGTLLNVLNPKLSLFFLAFLPQFVSTDTVNATASLIWLALILWQ